MEKARQMTRSIHMQRWNDGKEKKFRELRVIEVKRQ